MKKHDIVKAALNEFSRNSYDNASVNTIIQESHTSKGTFYHYFKHKEELYEYLVNTMLREKISFLEERKENATTEKTDNIFDLFRSQVDTSIDFSLAHPEYTAFGIQVRKEPNQDIREKILKNMGIVSSEYYHDVIQENMQKGFVRNDLPIDFMAGMISYMLIHFMEFLQETGCEISIENKKHIKTQYNYFISFLEKGLSFK
jgi:AcrR family transcriptional regulator